MAAPRRPGGGAVTIDWRAAHVISGLAAATATLASASPLTPLFASQEWLPSAAVAALLVAAVGILARAVRCRPAAVISLQTLTLVTLLALRHAGPTLAVGVVPTTSTARHLSSMYLQGWAALGAHSAPVPDSAGLDLLLTSSICALALVADAIAVTLGRPTSAALILAAPYTAAVANSDVPLPAAAFAGGCTGWLVLLAAAAPHRPAPRHTPRAASRRFGAGVALAAASIVGGLVVAASLPHTTPRPLPGVRSHTAHVGYSPNADLLLDLRDNDSSPVLTYRTDDPSPEPLRVSTASSFTDGRWLARAVSTPPTDRPVLTYIPRLPDGVPGLPRTITVDNNRLTAPALAAPGPVVKGSVADARWAMDALTGVLGTDTTPATYSLTYLDLEPTAAQLTRSGDAPAQLLDPADTNALDVSPEVVATATRVTEAKTTPYEKAMALQTWLRDTGGFTYTLDLPDAPAGMSPDEQQRTAVDRFLTTKRGYCVHFATAMTLMARSLDIPARYVTGFLPGRSSGDVREVRASDAHAWPELYFDGIGWLRFEPTPGGRSGTPPAYATPPQATPTSQSTAPTTRTSIPSAAPRPTSQAPTRPTDTRADHDADAVSPSAGVGGRALWWALPLLLAGALGSFPGWPAGRGDWTIWRPPPREPPRRRLGASKTRPSSNDGGVTCSTAWQISGSRRPRREIPGGKRTASPTRPVSMLLHARTCSTWQVWWR